MSTDHRGFYHRGYLPHIDEPHMPQMVTYRLADSLPKALRDDDATSRADLDRTLDEGSGASWLGRRDAASIVVENWKYHDGSRYRLRDWVVMPNHVHVSYDQPETHLDAIVHSWKSYTSNRIKDALDLPEGDQFWQRGYFDRYIRDRFHFFDVRCYIVLNPFVAGLVDDPFDWPYSSIHNYAHLRDSFERWFERWRDRFWNAPYRDR